MAATKHTSGKTRDGMTIEELMRPCAASRQGYEPQSIGKTTLAPEGCGFLRRLLHIPPKITAYFRRDLISSVWKTKFGGIDATYYIIRATDDTLFHVEY